MTDFARPLTVDEIRGDYEHDCFAEKLLLRDYANLPEDEMDVSSMDMINPSKELEAKLDGYIERRKRAIREAKGHPTD